MKPKTLVLSMTGALLAIALAYVIVGPQGAGALPEDPPGVTTIILDYPPSEEDPLAAESRKPTLAEARANMEAQEQIEDELADTEDPGAVYYMSRIREAMTEGNPAFAQVLLGQMKAQHASSALVSHAEALCDVE